MVSGNQSSLKKHILILTSHGIRTNAPWQEDLERLVLEQLREKQRNDPNYEIGEITFRHNDYLYFGLPAFLNPFRRKYEVKKFKAELEKYVKDDTFDEIHLVGHSFGTHIIAHALLELGAGLRKKIGTVILASSVLHKSFPWHKLIGVEVKRLVNECGDLDAILVLNAFLPFGSGLAGRRGFPGVNGDHFRNRYFSFGHSGYFEPRSKPGENNETWFMERYWIPLLSVRKPPHMSMSERTPCCRILRDGLSTRRSA